MDPALLALVGLHQPGLPAAGDCTFTAPLSRADLDRLARVPAVAVPCLTEDTKGARIALGTAVGARVRALFAAPGDGLARGGRPVPVMPPMISPKERYENAQAEGLHRAVVAAYQGGFLRFPRPRTEPVQAGALAPVQARQAGMGRNSLRMTREIRAVCLANRYVELLIEHPHWC